VTLLANPNLTKASPLEERIASTHRGMAYWAGTGPGGTTCGECSHFKLKRGLPEGYCMLRLPGAKKARTDADAFPAATASCRHFKAS